MVIIDGLLEGLVRSLGLMVCQYLGLEVAAVPFPLFGIQIFENRTFCHYNNIRLVLLPRWAFCDLFAGLYGKVVLVYIYYPFQSAPVVIIPHCLSELVHHGPKGLVFFQDQLPLYHLTGGLLFRGT